MEDAVLPWGIFIHRPNRFLIKASLDGKLIEAFCPNPGRLTELLVPGARILLKLVDSRSRKTKYDVLAVGLDGFEASVDSRVPNIAVGSALRSGDLPEFVGYDCVTPEFSLFGSRLDFHLSGESGRCVIEVKSCTLVKDKIALFPDSPTERGRRHLVSLIRAKHSGIRAAMIFAIQRSDAETFSPNDEADPEFGRQLRMAASEDVEIYAYRYRSEMGSLAMIGRAHVKL